MPSKKTPSCSLSSWCDLYSVASNLLELPPSSLLGEEDLFVLQNPITKELGYCCLTGKERQTLSFLLYRGKEAFDLHMRLKKGEIQPTDPEICYLHNAIVWDLQGGLDPDEEDEKVYSTLPPPLQKQGSPFVFRSYLPGFQGWYLTEEEVFFLQLALRCAILCGRNLTNTLREESSCCPLYLPRIEQGEILWEVRTHTILPITKKEITPLTPDLKRLAKLKSVKLYRDTAWEISFFHSNQVFTNQERPSFVKVALVVHQESLLVLQAKALDLGSTPALFLAEVLIATIERHKRIPSEIVLDRQDLQETLKPLARALGIQTSLVSSLSATPVVQDSLNQYMDKN